jgi:hypothetical protein
MVLKEEKGAESIEKEMRYRGQRRRKVKRGLGRNMFRRGQRIRS